jgi:GT2 family glycosyltransferase
MSTTSPPSEAPEAAVIIPHYNDVARLERCLAALMANDLAGVEVLVVDNGSTEPLEAVRAVFPAVRFVTEPEKGAAAARNRGVGESSAPRLFFLDADCVPAPDWLAVARRVAPEADLIGGRVEVFDETPPPRSGVEAFEAVFAFRFRDYVERQGFAGAGNLLTRRDVFGDVGGFVNGLAEDRDWCLRATAKGYRLIYADGLKVGHPSRSDWPALRRKWLRLTRESWALARETRGAAARPLWLGRAFVVLASIGPHLAKVLTDPRLNGPGERFRAAGTLIRLRLLRVWWMLGQVAGLDP